MSATQSSSDIAADSQTVRVELAARAYDIHIGGGLLVNCGKYIAPLLKRPRVAIVTDTHVAKHHLPDLQKALTEAKIAYETVIIEAGEASKSFAQLEALCGRLMDFEIERDDCIIALGGGVIGDLTGFAAAILRRGTRFIQIPTSLLAQVDSSIGGKTAINAGQGKNLIGAFHQPELVLADTNVLASLPQRQIIAGYAEIVKYGALGNADFFDWLDDNLHAVLALEAAPVAHAVAESCRAKAAIVARDERESGERALLNLGHTFAHAFEKLTNYGDALLHGEAVGFGMVLAFALSAERGDCSQADADRVKAHMQSAGLPISMAQIGNGAFGVDALIEAMRQDKKMQAGTMRFILARGIGEAFVTDTVTEDQLRGFLIAQGAQN